MVGPPKKSVKLCDRKYYKNATINSLRKYVQKQPVKNHQFLDVAKQ